MPEDNSAASGFKVVDRRIFGSDGSRREATLEAEKKPPSDRPAADTPSGLDEAVPEESFEEGDANFATLINSLSTTAMLQLGLFSGPSGEPIPADLNNAQRTIDLLDVLQQKTRGNLTPEEEQLLEDSLYDLRMAFVEVQKRFTKNSK